MPRRVLWCLPFILIGMFMFILAKAPTALAATPARAHGDLTPTGIWIVADYELRFITMEQLTVNATYSVHELSWNDESFTADQLRENYSNGNAMVIENVSTAIAQMFDDFMCTSFANDSWVAESIVLNTSSLTDTEPHDPYQPPLKLDKNASIRLNQTSFGFCADKELSLDDVLRGVLKMGAVVEHQFELTVEPGVKWLIRSSLPADIVAINGTEVIEIDNRDGSMPLDAHRSLIFASTNPNIFTAEDIAMEQCLDMPDFDVWALNGTLEIKAVAVDTYNVTLPSSVKHLSYISADGIRMALDNELLTWQDVESGIRTKSADIERQLGETFNTSVRLSLSWNATSLHGYDVSTMSAARPLFAMTNATLLPRIYGELNGTSVKGFLNAGAQLQLEFTGSDEDYTLTMLLPRAMNLSKTAGASYVGLENARHSYKLDTPQGASFTLYSELAPRYEDAKANLNVTIDISGIDLFELNIPINIDLVVEVYCWAPGDMNLSLPGNVSISYLNADLIRLSVDAGIVDIDAFLENMTIALTENYTKKFKEEFGETSTVDLSIHKDEASFKGYDVDAMSGERAVRILGWVQIELAIPTKLPGFFEFDQSFELSAIEDYNTTYMVILPDGIGLVRVSDDLGRVRQGTENGRDYFEVTLGRGEKTNIRFTISTLEFVIMHMLPFIVLSISISIISIFVRRMLKREDKKVEVEDDEVKV